MGGKNNGRKLFDMGTRRSLDEELEDESESSDEQSSIVSEVDNDISSSYEDADVAFLLINRDFEHSLILVFMREMKMSVKDLMRSLKG